MTEGNWQKLDAMVRERADDRAWPREILRRAGVTTVVTELARREGGVDDDLLRYSMEWAFFTRTQRGEYDTALYELERCWGRAPDSPIPHSAHGRPTPERVIHTLEDVHDALEHYVTHLAAAPIVSMATHISTEIDYRTVRDPEMAAALTRRETAGPAERDLYASYINEAFLSALGRLPEPTPFQFSFGAEALPYETGSFAPQKTIAQLAEMVARHPRVKFICYLSSRHANQSLCTLCRELPNLSLAGYWWHNFFPTTIRQVLEERLDMLPLNRQIGFFSDAYCVEWTYAKAQLVREQFAQVLAQKVAQGQYRARKPWRSRGISSAPAPRPCFPAWPPITDPAALRSGPPCSPPARPRESRGRAPRYRRLPRRGSASNSFVSLRTSSGVPCGSRCCTLIPPQKESRPSYRRFVSNTSMVSGWKGLKMFRPPSTRSGRISFTSPQE